jgi:gliding motility-associated-like protein
MKNLAYILFAVLIGLLYSCNKSTPIHRINCDGLVTDTLGKNDTGLIYIPTAFTPNTDGLNDTYYPITVNIDSINFKIYDNGNNILYSLDTSWGYGGTTIQDRWDGRYNGQPEPAGTYYYRLQTVTTAGNHIGVCGEFYLIRSCIPNNIDSSTFKFEDQLLNYGGLTGPTIERLHYCN